MTFLGFKIFRAKRRAGGGFKTVFQTDGKRLSRAKAAMKTKLQSIMHMKVEEQAARINSLLVGHFNYYGMAGNTRRLGAFREFTVRYWRKSLSRRSQNGGMTWAKMSKVFETCSLCPARIRIGYPMLTSYARL